MKRRSILVCILMFCFSLTFAESRASNIVSGNDTIETKITALKKLVQEGISTEEKYESSLFLAQIQEQFGEYTDASFYYTTAAGLIGTQTAKGQDLLLGAVRCALLVGDVSRADFLLSTALSSITDVNAKARANLYAVWSWIIKSETKEELAAPISVLKSYVTIESMNSVKPALLLTLHHLTNEQNWKTQLEKDFPNSPETAVVQGNAQAYPSPFLFFSTIKD